MRGFLQRHKRISWAFLIVVLVLAGIWAAAWWSRRDEERLVGRWMADAEEQYRRQNYVETKRLYEWVLKYHPKSSYVPQAYYGLGRFYLEYTGDLPSAQYCFWTQTRNYPFSRVTFSSLERLSFINRMSDMGKPYANEPYRQFITARRKAYAGSVVRRGKIDTGLAELKEILERYPESAVIPDVLATVGDVYMNVLKCPSLARPYYAILRAKYPESEQAKKIPPDEELNKPDITPEEIGKIKYVTS